MNSTCVSTRSPRPSSRRSWGPGSPTAGSGTTGEPAGASRSDTRRRVFAGETDGVHHHVVLFGTLHDVLQRVVLTGKVHRLVYAVGEDEDDATPALEQQRVDTFVD